MPYISRFFGIVVQMFFNDHLPPHFHATYGEYEAVYEIETRTFDAGNFRAAHTLWSLSGRLFTEINFSQIGRKRGNRYRLIRSSRLIERGGTIWRIWDL
jgi:Domain of unknown function (DUF4160)